MIPNQTNLLRKYGKTIFKLLEKRWIREVPLAGGERKRDRFKEEEIKRKIVRAAIGRASEDDNRRTEREERDRRKKRGGTDESDDNKENKENQRCRRDNKGDERKIEGTTKKVKEKIKEENNISGNRCAR